MSSNKKSTNMNSNSKAGGSAISDSRNNRRSSRIQNTKDTTKIEASEAPVGKNSKVHPKQYNVNEECSKNNKISMQGELEALFDQSDEEESFGSMFEGSFKQQHTKSINLLSCNRLTGGTSNSMEDVEHNISNTYIATSSNLQPEDVSKVLKILSQPNNPNDAFNPKPKPCLKTYSNPRKSSQKTNIVESFGLPDTPIVSERPLVNNILDTEILDASEITILDIKNIDDPWNITNLNRLDFSDLEEIRVKSDPQKHFKIPSGNLKDIQNNDFVFTSTPQIKQSRPPKNNLSSVNRSSDKEVDIDAIKSNIRKLFSEKSLEMSRQKNPSDTSCKQGRNSSKVVIQNGNTSLEDSEMEIFNTPSISLRSNNTASVKNNSLSVSKPNKHQNIQKHDELEVALERRKNLRSSVRCQESIPNNARNSVFFNESSKHTGCRPNKDESIDEEVDEILSKPRSDVPETPIRNKKKLDSVEHRLSIKLKLDEIIVTPRRILRSKSSLDIPLAIQPNKVHSVKKLPVRNIKSSLGRRLRSMSQENVCLFDGNQKNISFTTKVPPQMKTRSSLNSSTIDKKTIGCDGYTLRRNSGSIITMRDSPQRDGVPQLKVLLSPLKPSIFNDRSPQWDNPSKNPNTTRKSLRSYKETPEVPFKSRIKVAKLVSRELNPSAKKLVSSENNSVAESLFSPVHSAKATAIENNSESNSNSVQEAMQPKRRQRIPQIFDEGSSSSENADIDLNHCQETLSLHALPEKVVETDENPLGLFTDDFSKEIPVEFQQNELEIQNNINELPSQAKDNGNDAETTVEMVGHISTRDVEESSDVMSKTQMISEGLPEKDSKDQINALLVLDIHHDSSSRPFSAEVVEAAEESKTIESVHALTEAHINEADDLGHEKLSVKTEEIMPLMSEEIVPLMPEEIMPLMPEEIMPLMPEEIMPLIPKEIISAVPEVSLTETQIGSASHSGREPPVSASPIPEASTTNIEGSSSKCCSVAEEETVAPLRETTEVGTDSNNALLLDKTEATLVVLDSVVVSEGTLESLESVEEQKSSSGYEETGLYRNETGADCQENSMVGKDLSAEANPEIPPIENQYTEVRNNEVTPVVEKDNVESSHSSITIPETVSTDKEEVHDEKDEGENVEVNETVESNGLSTPESPVIHNLRRRKAVKKKLVKLFKIRKVGPYKLRNQSRPDKSRKLTRTGKTRAKTLLVSGSMKNSLARSSSKGILRSIPLRDCSQSELPNRDIGASIVEAELQGLSTNECLGDLESGQQGKRKRGRPRKVIVSRKQSAEKTSLPNSRLNGEILENKTGGHTPEQINVRKRGRPRLIDLEPVQQGNRKHGRPKKVIGSRKPPAEKISLPNLRRNGEILKNMTRGQASELITVRKRGRPRKVEEPKTSPTADRPGMSREVARLLECPSSIVFNSGLENAPKVCADAIRAKEGSGSSGLRDKMTVGSSESSAMPLSSWFNGASQSSPSQADLFLEGVFDSQNTIADHVKKRTREVISYKISGGNRLSGGYMKASSFEVPSKQNSSLRSWKSLDFSENAVMKDFLLVNSLKSDETVKKAADVVLEELHTSSTTPKANGDVATPALFDNCKRGRGRPSLVKKQPKVADSSSVPDVPTVSDFQQNGAEIAITAGASSVISNVNASKEAKKSVSKNRSNQNVSCKELELPDYEKEAEKRGPTSTGSDSRGIETAIPRSKTSLGARVRGSDIEDTPRVRGRPRRKSLDQAVSVTNAAEGNAKWKKSFSIIPTLKFSRKLRNAEHENLRDIRGNLLKFKVGSIAWAQIGSFPYWPCLITKELGSDLFTKNVLTKNVPRTLYHVRFFGDNGRRAWISKHKMMVYSSKEDLEKIYNEMRASNKFWPDVHFYYVKSIYQKKWICAVNEAQQVKSKNLMEKLQFFEEAPKIGSKADNSIPEDANKLLESPVKKKTRMSKSDAVSNIPDGVDTNKTAETVVKRKAKVSRPIDTPSSSSSTDYEAKISFRRPKKDPEHHSKSPKSEILAPKREIDGEEDKAEVFPLDPVLDGECQPPYQLAVKPSDDSSEVESKTSVDCLAIFSSHSLEAQKALFKRNTLFKGVSKEKVCQFCFKAGDVLKCRSGCNGVYHVRCAARVLQGIVPRGRQKRLSTKTILEEREIKEDPLEENETNDNNGPAEKDKENNANLMEDDHVQIITVPSSVYNTPPRKTFPPNFANLSLAEQIDYKMKEIMRKFESKTTYSDSVLEARSPEEMIGVRPLSRTRNVSRSRALFPAAVQGGLDERLRILPQLLKSPNAVRRYNAEPAKAVRHVTAESTLDQTSSSEVEEASEREDAPPKSSEDDSPREEHVTADSPGEEVKHEETKHVTADCEALESLQSENSNSNSSQQSKQSDVSEGAEGSKYVNPKYFKCGFCAENVDPYCFVCHQSVSKKGSNIRQKCSLYQCSRFYHPECLKLWPQTQWSLIQTTKHRYSQEEIDTFVCPQHVCHTCASDDPRAATSRCSGDKIVKCQRCPSTYHSTNLCVPAGSDILSSTQIVCPRHRDKSKNYTINTTWCFLCSEGGNLVCCETCPTSVHPECLPVNLTDDDKFICEDCESGRLPLYDEIVWVKLGKYRWWPGLVLFPNEIPPNVLNIKHSRGEFVVKFFGTYDHYWVNRGRSFLFQEGDAGDTAVTVKKKVEAAFNKAVEEAVVIHKLKKEFKLTLEAESLNSQKPPPYIKIKANKPVGNVRQMELDLSNTTACECDPSQPHPCGPDSDCLNRLLLTECNPEVCPAGKRCNNQCFEKRQYPPMTPYKTQSRGWGLKSLAPIKKGQFVVEYVGEIIDDEEYQRRIQKMHEQKEENYYFLTIDKDRMIDAGPKGNVARFMNHCCQPNCETQKWTVNGDTRVGLFAAQDIPAETELTFNYNLECIGKEKKICRCGAPNCSGFIGVKAKQETEMKRPKKTYKKKEPVKPLALPPCFICGKKGNVGACNNKICNKAYHLRCLKMTEWPESNKFVCPWHNCKICSKRTIRCCVKCINSYCPSHSEGNVRYDNLLGFVCTNHDPSKSQNERVPLRKKRSNVITEESAVTSTTSDDFEGNEDELPLAHRSSRRKKTRKAVLADSESEDFDVDNPPTSTPVRRAPLEPCRSQDETVSSATVSDPEGGVAAKRKRRRSRKIGRRQKRMRLSHVQNQSSTATAKDTNVNSKITRLEVDDR